MFTVLMWSYLIIGSGLGIVFAVALKKVLEGDFQKGDIFHDLVKDMLVQVPLELRIQFELYQGIVVPAAAFIIAIVWLPFFAICFLPVLLKMLIDRLSRYLDEHEDKTQ